MIKVLRFDFEEANSPTEVEADIALAIFAAECLYGRPRVRMETSYLVDKQGRSCVVEVNGESGEAAARVFAGLISVRVGEHAFRIESVTSQRPIEGGATR